MKQLQAAIYILYRSSALYYAWLMIVIGSKLWAQTMSWYQSGASSIQLFVYGTQSFLVWLHLVIFRGIIKDQAWALMISLLISGTHMLCALALPGLDIYTSNFLIASTAIFFVSGAHFFSRLAQLRA